MYLAGRWYTLAIGAAAPADESHASGLDVARLQQSGVFL